MDPQQALQLKDIHLPSNPSIWPLALGWWLLIAVLLVLVVWLFFVIRKSLLVRKHKRMLFNELAQLEQKLKDSPDKDLIAETNILLRRIALAYYPEARVASLTGDDWLAFLDKSGNTQNFSKGAGRILIDAPYRSGQLENYNGEEFISLIRNWVRRNAQKVGGCL